MAKPPPETRTDGRHPSETHTLGSRTRLRLVRVDRSDQRPWLQEAPLCPLLAQHQIVHTGIIEAETPFRVVRLNQSGTYFMASLSGHGQVLVDGEWQTCRAGTACLLPRYTINAFHAVPRGRWTYCYVRYHELPRQRPLSTAASPVMANFDPRPLADAISGLYHETQGAPSSRRCTTGGN